MFQFTHIHELIDTLYTAEIDETAKTVKVSWEEDSEIQTVIYTLEEAEKAFLNGHWIVQ